MKKRIMLLSIIVATGIASQIINMDTSVAKKENATISAEERSINKVSDAVNKISKADSAQEVTLKPAVLLDVPLISQMPELPRGCEVTSLAMMLQQVGINADKLVLAEEIKRDSTPYSIKDGQKYFGNPNTGFVGDMYSFNKPGYGVYHGPIKELAEKYLPGRIIDFTGGEFKEILTYLSEGKSVWVINNVLFDNVPEVYWQTWQTPIGSINITMKEHSVLVTGYDGEFIYFNDPLTNEKNRKVPMDGFVRGWEQMGRQAITFE